MAIYRQKERRLGLNENCPTDIGMFQTDIQSVDVDTFQFIYYIPINLLLFIGDHLGESLLRILTICPAYLLRLGQFLLYLLQYCCQVSLGQRFHLVPLILEGHIVKMCCHFLLRGYQSNQSCIQLNTYISSNWV
jgi:hypothetical protein